jgi:hypothetical protein
LLLIRVLPPQKLDREARNINSQKFQAIVEMFRVLMAIKIFRFSNSKEVNIFYASNLGQNKLVGFAVSEGYNGTEDKSNIRRYYLQTG